MLVAKITETLWAIDPKVVTIVLLNILLWAGIGFSLLAFTTKYLLTQPR